MSGPWAVSLLALDQPDTMTIRGAPAHHVQGDTARRDGRQQVGRVTERVHPRRRASDRAEERANRAAKAGDLIGLWVASGQADEARRRRDEYAERDEVEKEPIEESSPAVEATVDA
jgi:hypothetical protein